MTPNTNLEDLLRSLDPLTQELDSENATHADAVWEKVQSRSLPAHRHSRRRRWVGVGSLATVGVATAMAIGLLPGTSPISAAAATLRDAARADAAAAALPALAPGQYYYQEAHIAVTCVYTTTPDTGAGVTMTYLSEGTMHNWTSANGVVETTLTPTAMDEGGSHFATSADQSAWIAAGRPFINCPLALNSTTDGTGQGTTTVEMDGWGFVQRFAKLFKVSTFEGGGQPFDFFTVAGGVLVRLPASVPQIATLLANGQVTQWGLVLASPQVCPTTVKPLLPVKGQESAPTTTTTGCNANQQLAIIEQLLQFPGAAQKLGSVLYDIAAQMPGATVTPNVIDNFGATGSLLTIPLASSGEPGTSSGADVLEILFDPTSGALLSTTVVSPGAATRSGTSTSSIGYGPIGVVNGIGAVPKSSNSEQR